MLALAAEREVLHVVDDQVGSPTWARAIADETAGILRDVGRAREASGIYNVAARGAVSRYDFIRRALELAEMVKQPRLVRIGTPDFPLPAPRPLNSVLDTAKFRSTFAVEGSDWEHQLRACLTEMSAVSGI
jgi:dTDP-4-dehydrorhamnose reductase